MRLKLVLGFTPLISSCDQMYAVSGTVVDEDSKPLKGATLQFDPSKSGRLSTDTSDAEGHFVLTYITGGLFEKPVGGIVSVSMKGYVSQVRDVEAEKSGSDDAQLFILVKEKSLED